MRFSTNTAVYLENGKSWSPYNYGSLIGSHRNTTYLYHCWWPRVILKGEMRWPWLFRRFSIRLPIPLTNSDYVRHVNQCGV